MFKFFANTTIPGSVEYIIAGLGNPGKQYENTRHNAGFVALDAIAKKYGASVNRIRFKSICGETCIAGKKVLLLKPSTFMNLSGQCVSEVLSWYKLTPEETLIVLDDIDLPFGTVRVRPHGGAGTHNGLRNIVYLTGSDRFPRIRVGVGDRPENWELADWVLAGYQTEAERKIAFDAYCLAADAAACFVTEGIDKAMNRFNKKDGSR